MLQQQRELAPQRTDPFCSACGQTADLPSPPAAAPEGFAVWEQQVVAWVPAEPARSCRPLPPASASLPQALTHVRSPHWVQLQVQHLGFYKSGHPCSGPSTSSPGLEKHLCSGLHRTLASCCYDGGHRAGCRCERQGPQCAAHVTPVDPRQEPGEVMQLPRQHAGRESLHRSC